MPKKSEKIAENNKSRFAAENLDQTGNNDNDTVLPVKHRGRPKGSKNKTVIKRPDKTEQMSIHTEKGENTKYLVHDMKLIALPDIDTSNKAQVEQRIKDYFFICSEDDIKPSVESLALSFGVSRHVLYNWLNGRTENKLTDECIRSIKKAYDAITSYYAHMMNNGKINPIAGIFLMKNNMGYKDTTEYTISANSDHTDSISDITNRAGLLD